MNFRLLYSNAKPIFVLVRENSKKTLRKYSLLFPTSGVWPWIILSLLSMRLKLIKVLTSWKSGQLLSRNSNLFRSYSPEDDDENAIVAILFPNDGKAVNYFIQFAKFQNRIC